MRLVEFDMRKYDMVFGPGNYNDSDGKYKQSKILINPQLVVSVEKYKNMDDVSVITVVNEDSFIVEGDLTGIVEILLLAD